MAKEREKKQARILYVELGKTINDIRDITGVSERTVHNWISQGKWKEERAVKNSSPTKRINNVNMIITNLSEERIETDNLVKEKESEGDTESAKTLREQIAKTDAAAAYWNKILENIQKESKVTASTYLYVMEQIFEAMRKYDEKLYLKCIAFQEHHINETCNTIK